MGDCLDLSGRTNLFVGLQAAFGVDEVGCKDGIDQGGFSQTSLA